MSEGEIEFWDRVFVAAVSLSCSKFGDGKARVMVANEIASDAGAVAESALVFRRAFILQAQLRAEKAKKREALLK